MARVPMNSLAPDKRPRRRSMLAGRLIRDLRARGLLLPGVVGLAVAATLVQGVLARSPGMDADMEAPGVTTRPEGPGLLAPPEANPEVLESLRPGLEKTPLSYFADYWLQLGAVARPKLVRLGDAGLPGIVVLRGLVVAPLAAAEPILEARRAAAAEVETGTETGNAEEAAAEAAPAPGADGLMGIDSELGIALLRLPGEEAATAFSAAHAEDLSPGSLLAAISLAPRGGLRVVPGYLASTRPLGNLDRGDLDASVAMQPGSPLAALVNLDGELIGIAVHSDGEPIRYWSYEEVARTVARLASDATCRAFGVAPLDPEVAERLGVSSGVVVASIHPGALGPQPAVRPGDVLLQWGGESVPDVATFEALYDGAAPGDRVRVRLLRDRRRSAASVEVPGPGCLPVDEPPERLERLGADLEWTELPALAGIERTEAWRIRAVDPGSAAAAAGLAAGEWILAVDGRSLSTRTLEPFQPFEQRGRTAALTVLREDGVRIVPVRPADPDAG